MSEDATPEVEEPQPETEAAPEEAAPEEEAADEPASEEVPIEDTFGSDEVAPEPEAKDPPAPGSVVGARTRQVQYGETSLDIVEDEEVEVPDGLLDSWVEMGWVYVVPEEAEADAAADEGDAAAE